MNLKQQVALGTTITLGTVFLIYLYQKLTTKKPATKPERSAARKRLSKYNPRPTTEDIQSDNAFQGRMVKDHQVSESGIIYHDIRYAGSLEEEPAPSSESVPEITSVDNIETIVETDVDGSGADTCLPVVAASTVQENKSSMYDQKVDEIERPSVTDKENINTANVIISEPKTPTNDSSNTTNTAPSDFVPSTHSIKSNGNISPSDPPSVHTSSLPQSSEQPTTCNGVISQAVTSQGVTGGLTTTEEFVRNVVRAKDKVENERRRDNSEIIQQVFNIPSKAVGKIIGKDGRSIKGIQRNSGARLQFPGNRDRSAPTQRLFIAGTLRQVEEAVAMIVGLMPADSICHELITWTPQVALSGDLKPVELVENTVCIGRVTHVTSPDSIWVQICRGVTGIDYLNMLSNLTDNITDTLGRKLYDMKNALLPVDQIKEGTSCAIMLEGRGYRGTVICPGSEDNNVHQVRLVDFGTPHSFTELFSLNSYYFSMPALAVQCSLAHISKAKGDLIWPEGAAKYLEQELADCFVKIRTDKAGHVPKVELYTEPSPNNQSTAYINRELVLDGYASWTE